MTDVAKLINVMILEYASFPITRDEIINLGVNELADQVCKQCQ